MAVVITQAEMIDEFLDMIGDRAWTIEEAHAWADSRTDPKFWKEGQNRRFLYEGQCHFLRKEINKRQALRAESMAQRDESPPAMDQSRSAMRMKTRHAVPRRDTEGKLSHEHELPLNLDFDEACRKIQEYLDLGKNWYKKARELYDLLQLEYPTKKAKKLEDHFKNNKTWQQCMAWEDEDLVG